MVLDLDHLRTINDSLGHSVGDQLLVAVAQRLAGTISRRNTLTHLGEDEFALLVEGCGSSDDAVQAADRVHAALRRPFQLDGHDSVRQREHWHRPRFRGSPESGGMST